MHSRLQYETTPQPAQSNGKGTSPMPLASERAGPTSPKATEPQTSHAQRRPSEVRVPFGASLHLPSARHNMVCAALRAVPRTSPPPWPTTKAESRDLAARRISLNAGEREAIVADRVTVPNIDSDCQHVGRQHERTGIDVAGGEDASASAYDGRDEHGPTLQ
mmetsp:Transcript_101827/g.287246  ORF Transcript_101827/g.287246 Transcript_101827/m.287246 type:complete len:162 (-) Transcript_101827:173-658(-)